MTSSVRDYAILWLNGRVVDGGGGTAQGGNVILNSGAHHLDGPEHLATSDNTDLDATTSAHGLLTRLSGSVGDALRGDGTFGGLDHGGLSGLGDDDHPQYTTDAEAEAIADAEIVEHEAESDPHPQYLTEAEADALYDPLGAAGAVAGFTWKPVMATSPNLVTSDGGPIWLPWVTVDGEAVLALVPA